MNNTFKAAVAVILALALSVLIVIAAVLLLPTQFDRLYLGELADKYSRLRGLDGENKLVIIGGSSVPFGTDSQMIEESLGVPVVDFGMYGPLGTAVMMDLTRGNVNAGDIIVLAPETDPQTMSMTFNGEAMWDACDSDYTMLFKVRLRNWGEMLGSFWTYALQKYQFYISGKPENDGVYSHDSFNEYGDIEFFREAHEEDDWFAEDVLVDLSPDIVDQDYIDYINDYIAYCESRGATVYFTWPPMNALAVQQDTQGILEYATFIRDSVRCQIISNISDYIMDAVYFYDTNYHLTSAGAAEHTARLIQDLWNFMGDGSPIDIDVSSYLPIEDSQPGDEASPSSDNALPADQDADEASSTPEQTEVDIQDTAGRDISEDAETGSSRDAAYFTYEEYNEGLMITGVTDEGKEQETLEIPWMIDGQKVIAIGENALMGCDNLRELYIQKNISRILQSAFDGAPRLTAIHLDNDSGGSVLVPGIDLFANVPGRTKVYVPEDAFGTYIADYFWGNYLDRLEKE